MTKKYIAIFETENEMCISDIMCTPEGALYDLTHGDDEYMNINFIKIFVVSGSVDIIKPQSKYSFKEHECNWN